MTCLFSWIFHYRSCNANPSEANDTKTCCRGYFAALGYSGSLVGAGRHARVFLWKPSRSRVERPSLSSSTHPSSSHASPLYSHPSRFLVVQWAQLLILKTIWEESRLTAGGFQILETREKRESPSSFVLRIKLMHTRRDWSKEFTLKCAFSVNVDGYYINTGFESSNRISILDH